MRKQGFIELEEYASCYVIKKGLFGYAIVRSTDGAIIATGHKFKKYKGKFLRLIYNFESFVFDTKNVLLETGRYLLVSENNEVIFEL